jgi:DNA-binding transcriptional LysR family regulator
LNLTIKQLQILHAVVVAGSISQATRSVGLSQPTLSQHLAKFEEELGTQLIVRGKSAAIRLTAAGEFWFRVATEVIGELDSAAEQHRVLFDDKNLSLRFGTTASLRSHFTELIARSALDTGQISRVEYVLGTSSDEVVEMVNTHRLNCGVVSEASIGGSRSSLHVESLWRDRIVWIVPADAPDDAIGRILAGSQFTAPDFPGLTRHVKIDSVLTWAAWSDDWYRHRLPFAAPFFGSMTNQISIEIVAAGLATAHVPMSLLHNLPLEMRGRIKYFDLGEYAREVVLIMPRHLLSLDPFRSFCDAVCNSARKMMLKEDEVVKATSAVQMQTPPTAVPSAPTFSTITGGLPRVAGSR